MIAKVGLLIYAVSSLIPLLKSDQWWIRVLDFPRLQLLAIGIGLGGVYYFTSTDRKRTKLILLAVLSFAAAFDLYRVLPYSPVWPVESRVAGTVDPKRRISLITVNVLQSNREAGKLLAQVEQRDPDLVLVLEVDAWWLQALKSLEEKYPHQLKMPLDNEYGLSFYSKLPLRNGEVKFLVEPDVPSISGAVTLPSGDEIQIYGLHPRPPRPDSGDTTERDAELVLVAKAVRDSGLPTLVFGDLNDVAWSHTTRLFRRVSKMLDPRVGRGTFSTFPVTLPIFRFPLDYVFHSDVFRLEFIERLEDMGSDHYPMYAAFVFDPRASQVQEAPTLEKEDLKEAEETLERSHSPEK